MVYAFVTLKPIFSWRNKLENSFVHMLLLFFKKEWAILMRPFVQARINLNDAVFFLSRIEEFTILINQRISKFCWCRLFRNSIKKSLWIVQPKKKKCGDNTKHYPTYIDKNDEVSCRAHGGGVGRGKYKFKMLLPRTEDLSGKLKISDPLFLKNYFFRFFVLPRLLLKLYLTFLRDVECYSKLR